MNRSHAIGELAGRLLLELSHEERREQLEMMLLSDWSSDAEWHTVPQPVRLEFERGAMESIPDDVRYDPVLLVWLRSGLRPATSEYIRDQLARRGFRVESVDGEPIPMAACPCCGLRSLEELASFEICTVCWWEDDGQDNTDADEVRGGPNYHLSLTQARVNMLREGIHDPGRDDLRPFQDPAEKYPVGREFRLEEHGAEVVEPKAGWRSRAFE